MKSTFYLLGSLALAAVGLAAGRAVPYEVDGKAYEGWFVSPKADAPLVLLVHDWDGLTDYEVRRAEMLAEAGYAAFAVDLYGAGVRPTELEDKRRQTGALTADRAEMRRRLTGGLAAAVAAGADTTGAVAAGWCFGGTAVLEWARSGMPFAGFVTFHGGLETPEGQDWSAAQGELLVLHGGADASVPTTQLSALSGELEAAGVPHELVVYSGAPHAFTVFGSERYRAEADRRSWRRFLEFLGDLRE